MNDAEEAIKTSHNQQLLRGNRTEIDALNRKLLLEKKLAERKNKNKNISNDQKLLELKSKAEKEGKLIAIHQATDQVEHKLSLAV